MGCFGPDAPEARDYAEEYEKNLTTQIKYAPQLYASEAEYQPKYSELALQNLNTILGGSAATPGLFQLMQRQSSASRLGDIQDVEQYGARATAAMLAANPEQAALLQTLNRQAMTGLEAGNNLTPDEQRLMQQSSRGAYAARGMGGTNTAVADEIARQMAYGDTLLKQRQALAGTVLGYNQAVVGDPWQQILGRSSGAAQLAQNTAAGAGASVFNPESSYAGNLYNSNQQAEALYGASSNPFASITGMFTGLGNLGMGIGSIWGGGKG